MKTIATIFTIALFAGAAAIATAQEYPEEYLGLPGDNLNLYAVMNLFQESETLEGFEQSLNDEESRINNLDLNGDNLIDYITVSDYVDENAHTIVLRAAMDRNEQQDVAVFVVEKLRNGEVQIQLIGDEALYGQNYIIEPFYAETPNPGYTGKTYRNNTNVVTSTYYDIAAWPVIRFMYYPGYRVWRSSWYWGYYPSYWRPWRPSYWHYYYGYHYHWHDHYYSHYRHWNNYRCRTYNTYYRPHVRLYSPTVVVNVNKGHYRNTYSRPDQRRAGEELYARTNTRSRTTRSQTAVNAQRSNSRNGLKSGATDGKPGPQDQAFQQTGAILVQYGQHPLKGILTQDQQVQGRAVKIAALQYAPLHSALTAEILLRHLRYAVRKAGAVPLYRGVPLRAVVLQFSEAAARAGAKAALLPSSGPVAVAEAVQYNAAPKAGAVPQLPRSAVRAEVSVQRSSSQQQQKQRSFRPAVQ